MRQVHRQMLLVAAAASVVMFSNLGGPRLWDRDEPRNAGCAAEMLGRHDWVTPVFNAELRSHKPVLLYWLIMSAYGIFGVNEFAARFWSAALAIGTVCCTYAIGRRLFGASAGMWAGIALASSLMFDVAGRAATPDSVLIFFSTLALTIYVRGCFPSEEMLGPAATNVPLFPAWPQAALMYAAMGMAVLAKGPVGLVLPTAVIGMFLLIMRLPGREPTMHGRLRQAILSVASVFEPRHFLKTCWMMRPITAIAAVLVVAAPWYIWVGIRTEGEFLREFFLEHNLSRATQPMEGHSGPIFYYLVAICVGFFPWSVFATPVVLETIRVSREDRALRRGCVFAAVWIGVYVSLFSLASTKLPSYVTPCYPALSLLTGLFMDRWVRGVNLVSSTWLSAAIVISAVLGLALLVGLPIAAHLYLPGEEWLGAVGLPLLLGGLTAIHLARREQRLAAASVYAVAAVTFAACVMGAGAWRVGLHQQHYALLDAINDHGERPSVAALGVLEPTWVFYGGWPIDELLEEPSPEVNAGVARQSLWIRKPHLGVDEFINSHAEPFILTSDRHLDALTESLPARFTVLAEAPRFLRGGKLYLIGPESPTRVATKSPDGTDWRR